MATMDSLVAIFVFGVLFGPPLVVGMVIGWVLRGRKERRSDASIVGDHQRLDRLVEDIQFNAYEHMTLGEGTLAPIVVDLIRTSEKERAKGLLIHQAQQAQEQQGAPKTPFISLTSMPAPGPTSASRASGLPLPSTRATTSGYPTPADGTPAAIPTYEENR